VGEVVVAPYPQPLRGANIGFDVVRSTIFAARRADILPLRGGGEQSGAA
jgi:hypothetical protein